MRLAIALGLLVALAPAFAAAQELPVQLQEQPSFDTSTALHVAAAIVLPIGTGVSLAGGWAIVNAFGCDFCDDEFALVAGFTIPGLVLVAGGLAMAITATVLHGRTRAQLQQTPAVPFAWGTPDGGGGLVARF